MTTAAEAKSMWRWTLDADYERAYRAGDTASATVDALEIQDRIQNPMDFLASTLGISDFPKYEAIQAERARSSPIQDAQSSVVDHAQQVGATIAKAASFTVGSAIAIGLVAALVIYMVKKQ